ncbi:uncharacterized protein LOC129969622 [Argiope bruennichi]|uniref:uncharacterized protein LOC129969622 n=1 Tax=Argiope bruennichi TaxID=94029 RepID=UPI002493FDE1|nr:uncharacterized protein LOC129969622 [Argiope bruennichi]
MENKSSIAILCFLGLFVIAQGLTFKYEDLEQYYKCWTYSNCVSDEAAQKIEDCLKILKPDELKSTFQYVEDNYYKYKNDDLPDAVKEYCNDYDDETKHDAYDKTLNGVLTYEKKLCGEDKAGECSRLGQTIGCVFSYLDVLKQEGKCKTDN